MSDLPPVIDPTANVLKLVEKAVERLDDMAALRALYQEKLAAAESRRVDEQMALRASSDEKLRDAEAKRIDAIRAVDVGAVAIQNERAVQQASVLANQVSASKDALQALVASTADQLAKNLAASLTQILDRISALEKSQYQIGGRDIQRDVGKFDMRYVIGLVLGIPAVVLTVLALLGKL